MIENLEELIEIARKSMQKIITAMEKNNGEYPVDLLNKEEKLALLIENQLRLALNSFSINLNVEEDNFFLNEDFLDNIKKLCSLNTVEIVTVPTFIYDKKPVNTGTQVLQNFDRFLYEAQKYKGYVFIQYFSQSPKRYREDVDINGKKIILEDFDYTKGGRDMFIRYRCAGDKEMFLNTEAY